MDQYSLNLTVAQKIWVKVSSAEFVGGGGVLNGSIVGNRQTDLTSTYGIPFSMVRMPDTKFLAGLIVHM